MSKKSRSSQNAPSMQDHLPPELAQWIDERLSMTSQELGQSRVGADTEEEEVLRLIKHMSNVESLAKRVSWLLSAYAIRKKLATAARVGRESGVTQTSVSGRVASPITAAAWTEIWPDDAGHA